MWSASATDAGYETRLFGGGALFASDFGEEGDHLEIVGLAPFFERVVVAISTLQTLTEKQLGSIFDTRLGSGNFAQPSHGWVGLH